MTIASHLMAAGADVLVYEIDLDRAHPQPSDSRLRIRLAGRGVRRRCHG